jgi:hypothetical protein
MLFEERLGGEERRLMHLVPAPASAINRASLRKIKTENMNELTEENLVDYKRKEIRT